MTHPHAATGMSDPARMRHPQTCIRWDVFEIELDGPSDGNPFTDVELHAVFSDGEREYRVGGFYDGDGVYRIRFMPDGDGAWTFTTASNAPGLDGRSGRFDCRPADPDSHGPVRVDGRFHFAHADGTRYLPFGTTAYAWTHQGERLREETLRTLADSGFNKVRMCLLPKSYQYNENEPEFYPFPGEVGSWDTTRFDPDFFRRFEDGVLALRGLGVEADVILFHPYDRWGFADLGAEADDRLVRYTVRRLAAFANVWWAMANEYDLMGSKTEADWERLAAVVVEEDPYDHLRSIHNCNDFYDHGKPWITHVSAQRQDVYRTAENTDTWREQWGKPVVIDECAYEGDIAWGWGNITGEELVRRCWEGAVRGGYVQHGETYLNDAEELWWSKGGHLTGTSPERIAFLRKIIEKSPSGVLDPLAHQWDAPYGGVAGEYELIYCGFNQPRFRIIDLPENGAFAIDVIDTWNMTIERFAERALGKIQVDLPGRQYMAIRLTRES